MLLVKGNWLVALISYHKKNFRFFWMLTWNSFAFKRRFSLDWNYFSFCLNQKMCIYTRRLYKFDTVPLTWKNRILGSDHVIKMAGKTKAAERSESWLGSQFKFAQILARILVLFWVYLDLFSRFLPRQLEDDNGCFGRTATYFWTFAQRLCWIIANNYGWTINDYKAIYFILSVCLQL